MDSDISIVLFSVGAKLHENLIKRTILFSQSIKIQIQMDKSDITFNFQLPNNVMYQQPKQRNKFDF